jgi:uncharacterized protein YkwD
MPLAASTAALAAPSVAVETAWVTRVPAATPPSGALTTPGTGPSIDVEALKRQMLVLINDDRAAAGLSPVALDSVAAQAAQRHADEMAHYGYMSHWDLSGNGPPYRYSQAGGLDASQENVYMYWQRYDNGEPAPIEDWPEVIRQAEASLMDSPGHRANILSPEHTHVGLGLAYNALTGDVRLDQLFINHYVQIEPVPTEAALGQSITLRGQLEPGAEAPLLNLAYEPFPKPMTVAELNQTGTYTSATDIYDASDLGADADGRFEKEVALDNEGRPGLYYVRIWVQTRFGEILATEIVVAVR